LMRYSTRKIRIGIQEGGGEKKNPISPRPAKPISTESWNISRRGGGLKKKNCGDCYDNLIGYKKGGGGGKQRKVKWIKGKPAD